MDTDEEKLALEANLTRKASDGPLFIRVHLCPSVVNKFMRAVELPDSGCDFFRNTWLVFRMNTNDD